MRTLKAFLRWIYGPFIAWAILSILFLTLYPAPAHAQPDTLTYNRQLAIEQEIMVRQIIKTERCMHTAAKAMLYQGGRDRQQILGFIFKTCGLPQVQHLMTFSRWSEKDATEATYAMAEKALDDVLSWGR